MFNDYFSKHCTAIDNNSSIPANINFETEERLATFEICSGDIVKIIRPLDSNKVRGHDGISIRMIKICVSSIWKPLASLFRNCVETECFPKEWKKANIVPVHKLMVNNWSKIIDQYLYCLFVLKFLKKWYLTCFLNLRS